MSCNNIKPSKQECQEIQAIYLIAVKDCVFENNTLVRIKRKYGKHKRTIHKLK